MFSSDAKSFLDPVNTMGATGGLAHEFRRRFPTAYQEYLKHIHSGLLTIGNPTWCDSVSTSGRPARIVFFPTKDKNLAKDSEMAWIESGLDSLLQTLEKSDNLDDWFPMATPALGCGLGGLPWDPVCDTIIEKFSPMLTKNKKTLYLYKPW